MFVGTLHPYQEPGRDLLLRNGKGILAMEMGLGKSPTSLAVIEQLMEDGEILQPGIVLTLSSLKYQWAKAIEKFTDSKALVIDGPPKKRQEQYQGALNWMESGVDYIVMNYETMVGDFDTVKKLPRGFFIYDECTSLKGFRTLRHRAAKALARKVPYRIGLTGTPMTNGKPEELFAQLQVIHPNHLGNFMAFDERYIVRNDSGWVSYYRNLGELHERLSEVMYSKKQTDPDVAPYLPKTISMEPVLVDLDRPGRALYRKIANALIDDLQEADDMGISSDFNIFVHYGQDDEDGADGKPVSWPEKEIRGRISSKIMTLRMLCDHPELLRISADEFHKGTGKGSEYIASLASEGLLDNLKRAPKLEAVTSYVSEFLDQDDRNKVVIFSVFVPTLDLLQQAMKRHGSVIYTGSMNAKQKEAARTRFQEDPNTRLFISSDAGGFGVDLPQANLLINYDLPWSSGTRRQRNGRVQRASSEWEHVVIQDFLIHGSVEIRQWDSLQQKGRVEAAVVEGKGINDLGEVDMAVGTLRAFLLDSTL